MEKSPVQNLNYYSTFQMGCNHRIHQDFSRNRKGNCGFLLHSLFSGDIMKSKYLFDAIYLHTALDLSTMNRSNL